MDKKQSGSAHVIIIILLVIALIGTLGFVYWQNFMQPKDDGDKNISTSKETIKDDEDVNPVETYEGYIVLDDWDVKFKMPSDLGTNKIVYEKVVAIDSTEVYYISTERVSALGESCAHMFNLYRYEKQIEYSEGAPELISKVGNYYYYFSGPQSLCTDIGADIQLEDSTMLRAVLNNIEAK